MTTKIPLDTKKKTLKLVVAYYHHMIAVSIRPNSQLSLLKFSELPIFKLSLTLINIAKNKKLK